jgi:histidine phosphotransferase ChpT
MTDFPSPGGAPAPGSAPPPPAARTAGPPAGPTALASQLAARLCHDFVSPASAIVSGLDLLEDPSAADMREDAMNLIAASARKLTALLAFARVAFGSSAAAETFDTRELERLARGVFQHVRPELAWQVEVATLSKTPARILLNLAQLAADIVPAGGVVTANARVQGAEAFISVGCEGPRVRMKPEVVTGLNGQTLETGLGGAWIQAYFVHELARGAGGRLDVKVAETRVALSARLPE